MVRVMASGSHPAPEGRIVTVALRLYLIIVIHHIKHPQPISTAATERRRMPARSGHQRGSVRS
ncbi:hypothetical protein BRAS3843_2840007 [Bradyrhizobium sp. STM 3843]|nr:hypothetical protein BRAS3843_2840007 [Bradyrhizobium sp. STM 3843]